MNDECPICQCKKIKKNFHKHYEFNGYFFHLCEKCNHLWTDCKKIYSSNTTFKTNNKKRSEDYANYILEKYKFNSLIEIGSGNDFYFLNYLHNINPSIKKYLHDNFDYSNFVSKHIKFIKNIEEDQNKYDILYMCHSLEHIIEPLIFLQNIRSRVKKIIIDIPLNDKNRIKRFERTKKSGYHYHYYSDESILKLFEKNNFKVEFQKLVYNKENDYCGFFGIFNTNE